ncbi:3-ketosteroid-delta-1-dehydrogenase [Rhodococcus erythropolis R138]|uniref:FAD-binding protein n=1 Tax=Rhodococcus erythropolis TaxID=1833 RepID=UPI000492A68F|nr:FAD-binding protein [Rhodococcus erythropolis]ALU70745.1 3-ketosteroid-delta-1-dehydrogenase [Rhodococcus erythropolis R138]
MAKWDETCDVLAVGSGGGLAGAYTAAREGLDVIVIEATDKYGGTTAYSGGGGMWFPCNAVLRRGGDDDTIEDALEYYRSVVGDRTPADVQEAYVRGGAGLIDYLEEDSNFEFQILPWPDYFGEKPKARASGRHIVPKPMNAKKLGVLRDSLRSPLATERLGEELPAYLVGGQSLIGRFLLALSTFANAAMHLNTTLEELVVEDGSVVGAVVEQGGRRRTIRARRGVILAAGGFEQNETLRAEFGVPGSALDTMGCPGNLGKAHQAAIAVGADTDLMGEAWWSPGLTHPDGRSAFALWFTGGIFVDDNGRRFVNESAPYDRLGRSVIEHMRARKVTTPYWMIYDNREGAVPPVKAPNVPMAQTEQYVDAGLWKSAQTLEDLAAQIDVPAAELVQTVKRFNESAATGVDTDFGRGDTAYDRAFSEGASPLVPIDQGPFHAAAFGISDLGTKGGLRTDATGRVLKADGTAIAGLYAAGNTMAAASGTTYPGGGNPIGASMLFSHLAALDLTKPPS